ncbi:Facilitated trehalose transporter Tret1 [Eufriesea mexicana]|nr:Facilitated trehalose transporter Tret1 [Eufriesea mexicana]
MRLKHFIDNSSHGDEIRPIALGPLHIFPKLYVVVENFANMVEIKANPKKLYSTKKELISSLHRTALNDVGIPVSSIKTPTLSMVAVGTVYGWTTTSLSRLTSGDSDMPLKLTDDEVSWIVSLTVIGSMIGPFLGACLSDRFGRKRCLLLSSGFYVVGWLIVLFASTVVALYIARVVLGIGVGISYTTNPMYVSEVADINIRGALGTLIAVNVFTGSLLTCSIGPWVSYKVLASILLAIPILFTASFVWFPESPYFLVARGRKTEASKSLAFFKGIRDPNEVKKELSLIIRGLSRNDSHKSHVSSSPSQSMEIIKHSWLAKLRMLLLPNNARALCIVVGLIAAQQLSGNFSTMQYMEFWYTTNPMYVSEVADINIRGALGTLIAVNVFTGSLLTCSIGPWVSYKVLASILLAIPILFTASFVWFPESPYFLVARGRKTEASKSLAFFKGIRDPNEVKKELSLIIRGLSRNDSHKSHVSSSPSQSMEIIKHSWLAKLRMLLLPNNARALCIVVGLIAAQQLSGNFSTMQYMEVLFKKAAVGIDSNLATILVLAVGLISGSLATATVEGAGRRPLLMISTFGSCFTLLILAIYLMLDNRGIDVTVVNILPVIDVIVFQVAYQIGLGTLPNALIGELFPTEVKGVAGAIVTIFDGVLGFIVSKLYQVIGDSLGAYTVYYYFSASCFLAFLMVLVFVPETKGRTNREIQMLLAGEKRNSSNEETRNNENNFV